jgi:hypothetical protein
VKRYLSILLALALAACGSGAGKQPATRAAGSPSSPAGTATTSTTTPTTAATTSASTTSTSTTPSTSTSGGAAVGVACRASNLSLSFVGEDDAAGHGLLKFALKNVGSVPCHTYGFPGVQFLNAHGGGLTTVPHHVTSDYFGSAPETEIMLNPGQTASFRIGVTHGAIPGSVCTTAYGLQAIAPDDTAPLHTSIAPGAYECQGADVSPVEPGSRAYS